jgi:hypothetical protein
LDSQEETVLVEGVMKRELRELRIASLLATLLAAVGEGRVAQCLKDHASEPSPGCDQALTTVGMK